MTRAHLLQRAAVNRASRDKLMGFARECKARGYLDPLPSAVGMARLHNVTAICCVIRARAVRS